MTIFIDTIIWVYICKCVVSKYLHRYVLNLVLTLHMNYWRYFLVFYFYDFIKKFNLFSPHKYINDWSKITLNIRVCYSSGANNRLSSTSFAFSSNTRSGQFDNYKDYLTVQKLQSYSCLKVEFNRIWKLISCMTKLIWKWEYNSICLINIIWKNKNLEHIS